jgi:hypothetical protein
MMKRVLSLAAALALVVFVGAALAEEKADKAAGNTVVGTVSAAGAGKIIVTDKDGKDHAMAVAQDAKISIDGQAAKLEDLQKGTAVTLTLKADDKTTVAQIDAKTK